MATKASRSNMLDEKAEFKIGRVFTPFSWAKWLLDRYNVYRDWKNGATVFDPTCGQGSFFIALLHLAQEKGDTVSNDDLKRLFGVEINPWDKGVFLRTFREKFGSCFPEGNFAVCDFLNFPGTRRFDIAVGNPPWANFTDLPNEIRDALKGVFVDYGLVKNKRDVLLGGSRTDIASLVIQKCMVDHIDAGGCGYFFAPLSLFFNEHANRNFRPEAGQVNAFSVEQIIDFANTKAFDGVATRYGAVALRKNVRQSSVIPLFKLSSEAKERRIFCCVSAGRDAWLMSDSKDFDKKSPQITVEANQNPRQGMNTGGLNKVFILERANGDGIDLPETEVFTNGFGELLEISSDFVLPLMGSDLFRGSPVKRRRFILCLHDVNGKALDASRINELTGVGGYLEKYQNQMKERKGVLMRAWTANGRYWSLLGVGPYSFTKYKVAWESLGRRAFKAVVLDGSWQGNQAMHAYIPCDSRSDADRICSELNERVPQFLEKFGMEGTCNWAQPGRIKRVLQN